MAKSRFQVDAIRDEGRKTVKRPRERWWSKMPSFFFFSSFLSSLLYSNIFLFKNPFVCCTVSFSFLIAYRSWTVLQLYNGSSALLILYGITIFFLSQFSFFLVYSWLNFNFLSVNVEFIFLFELLSGIPFFGFECIHILTHIFIDYTSS